MLINTIHELAHTLSRFHGQRLSQVIIYRKPHLEGSYGHIFKVSVYFVKNFSIPVRIGFQGLSFSHRHGQQGIQRPGNSTTCHKSSAKSSCQFLIRTYRTFFQPIEPSYGNGPKAGRKNFAHEGLISRVNGHSLVKAAHMLYKINPSIIYGKVRLSKAMCKLGPINFAREG